MANEKESLASSLKGSNPFDFPPNAGPLGEANQAFHDSYRALTQDTRQMLGSRDLPVIVMHGDTVVLFHDGKREEAIVFPQLYHSLKAVSHLPFAVYITLATNGYGDLREKTLSDLKKQRRLAQTLLDNLATETILADRTDTSQKLLQSSVNFIGKLLTSGRLVESTVNDFAKEMAPLLLDNVAEAAQLELDRLHEQVTVWRSQIANHEWRNLYVVICSGHQARYRETSKQYFQRLLHEPESTGAELENRVVYAESIWDESDALNLLAEHLVDRQASKVFFGSPTRLQEDLLADATSVHLAKLLPN